jgi:hypothetical protein
VPALQLCDHVATLTDERFGKPVHQPEAQRQADQPSGDDLGRVPPIDEDVSVLDDRKVVPSEGLKQLAVSEISAVFGLADDRCRYD